MQFIADRACRVGGKHRKKITQFSIDGYEYAGKRRDDESASRELPKLLARGTTSTFRELIDARLGNAQYATPVAAVE